METKKYTPEQEAFNEAMQKCLYLFKVAISIVGIDFDIDKDCKFPRLCLTFKPINNEPSKQEKPEP